MESRNATARLAGALYLILVIFGIFNLMYVPSRLIVWEDPVQTLENIQQGESLFRLGIVAGILSYLAFLFLSLALYQLLHPVNKIYARIMVILVLVSIPLSMVNILHKFTVLGLLEAGQGAMGGMLSDQVMFYLKAFNDGITLSQVFWGLWLFPFGYLVYRSGFLPKVLGILLMLGCLGYLTEFFAGFLSPAYRETILPTLVGLPASLGEIGICLWLLIMGGKLPKWGRKLSESP